MRKNYIEFICAVGLFAIFNIIALVCKHFAIDSFKTWWSSLLIICIGLGWTLSFIFLVSAIGKRNRLKKNRTSMDEKHLMTRDSLTTETDIYEKDMNAKNIEMYCICDTSRSRKDEYIMYDPYYDVWHEPYIMDYGIDSSSLMKSDLEALQILKKLYLGETDGDYKTKIEANQIVIKKVVLRAVKNLKDCDNYEIDWQKIEWLRKIDNKVNLTEFSGNALNYICKNNPEYYKTNVFQDFDIDELFK